MKLAKKALAVLMSICMVATFVSIGFSAFAAEPTLQQRIDSAAPGSTVTLTKAVTWASVTINKDITIDLNGNDLKGNVGYPAITVKGGNVRIEDGQVKSYYKNTDSMTMLKNALSDAQASILVEGGNVTCYGLIVVGSKARVPTTTSYDLPVGPALQVKGGTVTVENSAFFGSYAAKNSGGTLIVDDGLFAGYMNSFTNLNAVQFDADKTEKVVANEEFLNEFRTMPVTDEEEISLVNKAMGNRVIAFVHRASAESVNSYCADGNLIVTVKPSTEDIEEKHYYSCQWRPFQVTLGDKDPVEFEKVGDVYQAIIPGVQEDVYNVVLTEAGLPECDYGTDHSIDIEYKLWFGFDKTNEDINSVLNYEGGAAKLIEDKYAEVIADIKPYYYNYLFAPKYDEYLEKITDAYFKLNDIANSQLPNGQFVSSNVTFKAIMKDLYLLGGRTMFAKGVEMGKGNKWSTGTEQNFFGLTGFETRILDVLDGRGTENVGSATNMERNGLYSGNGANGILRQLETEYLDRLGDENDADAIADFTYWAYQQYLGLITKDDQGKNVLDYAKEYVDDLFDLLEDPVIADLLDLVANASGSSDDISKTIDQLKSYKKSINDAYNFFYDRVLTSSKYNTVMNGLAARSEAELKSYVKDLQDFAQNATKYVELVIDEETNDWLRLMSGNQSYIYDASRRVVVDITVSTGGQVAYATSEGDAGVTYTTAKTGYKAGGSATLTAAPKAGFNSEFLYWVNNETNRIVSTAKTLVLNTSIDTDIEAVFNILPDQTYAFTNPTGWIQESYSQDGDETIVMLPESAPAMPGLTFTKWAAANEGDDSIDVATLAANATDVANKGAVLTSAVADQENGRVLSIGANYINTAAYVDAAGEMHRFNVEFIDNGVSTVLRQPIYSSAIYTAKGDGFKYWIDAETEEIVCLSARFQYKTIGDATFEAIYTSDAEVPAAVIRIAKKTVENGDLTFFVERSVAPGYSVVRSGAILTRDLAFAATDDFVLGAPRIGVGTAVDKGNTGVYAVTTSLDNGSTIGCRGYLEYKNDATGETFLIYTDAATYGG